MTPHACDLAVTGATVLPFDDGHSVIERCDLLVSEGRIIALGNAAAANYQPRQSLDGTNLIVIPGLCNAHTHSTEALARGRADGARLDDWLRAVWSGMDNADAAMLETAILLSAAEMLHGGVTSVVDHFRQTPQRADAIDTAARAWLQTGMRSTVALMLRDLASPPWVKSALPDARAQLALCADAHGRWRHDLLQWAIGPSAPARCSDELLAGAARLAAETGMRVHMHIDETRDEAARARELYGMSAVRHLERLALLGPQLSLAHAVWVDDQDIALIGATRTGVVHNPVSNLRLGSGRAPLERMLERGVPVAIGTDGAASNDGQSLLEAVKFAAMLPRIAVEDASRWPMARDVLKMGATAAARMFGMGAQRLTPGEPADFAAFDADATALAGAGDRYAQLALAGASLSARHVVIGGNIVLQDGRIRTFDEQAVRLRARSLGQY